MSRKVRRVPVTLDPGDIVDLPEDEIRLILRGADELIMSGGRGLLAQVLKGSRRKAVFDHGLDKSPVYGALKDLSLEQITARIDWLIINRYLAIEYDYRLPLLVYAPLGWEVEKATYADELFSRLAEFLTESSDTADLVWLTDKNPQVLELVLEKVAATGNPKYLPVLKRWEKNASRRISYHIRVARRAIRAGKNGGMTSGEPG